MDDSVKPVVDDDDLIIMLMGTEREANDALAMLHAKYGRAMVGYLKKRLPGLSVDHQGTAISRMYEALWHKGREQDFNSNRKLTSLVFAILYRKAVDLLRGETRQKRTVPSKEYHAEIAGAIHGTAAGSEWSALESRNLLHEVISDFMQFVGTLRDGTKLRVALVMADSFPVLMGPKDVHKDLLETDDPPTYDAVKRAYSRIMTEFRRIIAGKYKGIWP